MFPPSQRSRAALTIFAFVLGSFGAHRFYAGKIGTGVLQLILTLTLIGALISGPWALVDFILACAGKFRDREGRIISNW